MNRELVNRRLSMAKAAVAAVKIKLPLGAGNKMDDVVAANLERTARKAGYGDFLSTIARAAALPVAVIAEGSIITYRARDMVSGKRCTGVAQIREWARQAVEGKAGNCDDQSCVAFTYLYDNGVRPLDWMHLINGKHAFVLIGREDRSEADPATWGEDLVVCDPWNNDAYQLDAATGSDTLFRKMQCNCGKAASVFHAPALPT